MTARLLIAPAGAGKTEYAVGEARRAAWGLRAMPHVLVASALQARAFRRRMARAGGAIGVRVLTFEGLYYLCMSTTDAVYTQISDPVQHRVIRSVVQALPLVHYAPLVGRPGFVQVLKEVIGELKAARVDPERFAAAVAAHGGVPRLQELADIYAAYQARLQAEAWADGAGLGWLTAEALEGSACPMGRDWPLLLVDGFDDFTPVQLAVLAPLARRVGQMVITLTGSVDGDERPLVHRRFDRTRQELEALLGVQAVPLPEVAGDGQRVKGRGLSGTGPWEQSRDAQAGWDVSARLFRRDASPMRADGRVDLIEAPNRAEEVRAALRWLKAEVVEGGARPSELALLARDLAPYRVHVRQVAAEFGLPMELYSGEPLVENPAVVALMDLLRLMLPEEGAATRGAVDGRSSPGGTSEGRWSDAEPALLPRLVLEAWRSPYFDWCATVAEGEGAAGAPVGIEPGDADALGVLVRQGRVIAGLAQWEAAFELLARAGSRGSAGDDASERTPGEEDEAGEGRTRALPRGRVEALHGMFLRFVQRLRPPDGRQRTRHFVRWLETLIGPDPELMSSRCPMAGSSSGLDMVARIREGDRLLVERDVAALRCLKDVLRGLVWAEEALDAPPMSFPTFFTELSGAMEAAVYHLPRPADGEEILVGDVVGARGVPFRAVALMGLAEGLFPATQSEDALLHDGDRDALGLPLQLSTESAEAEYFYEAMAAPKDGVLLTRPRLTEDGAPWQASPLWEEVLRLVQVTPTTLAATSGPPPERAASWPELLQGAAGLRQAEDLWAWLRESVPEWVMALDAAVEVLTWRGERAESPFDGGLQGLRDDLSEHFGRDYPWSASRLEAYRTCPFHFFVSKVLGLEPRQEPAEGLDALQRGTVYHGILERVHRAVDDPTDLEQLMSALPGVATAVLREAPERQGFRETAWWAETRREMVEDVRRSLEALHEDELRGEFVPVRYEAAFGLRGEPPLIVPGSDGEDAFMLRGLIDRVDRDGEGRVRIIDYKSAGPWRYGNGSLRSGEKIQLPLYALAARDALGLGQVASGFYWHVRHAVPSPLKLEDFGPEDPVATAVAHAWEAIHSAREGHFRPETPKGGCPAYCPAAAFCWHYQRGYGG